MICFKPRQICDQKKDRTAKKNKDLSAVLWQSEFELKLVSESYNGDRDDKNAWVQESGIHYGGEVSELLVDDSVDDCIDYQR